MGGIYFLCRELLTDSHELKKKKMLLLVCEVSRYLLVPHKVAESEVPLAVWFYQHQPHSRASWAESSLVDT